VEKNKDWFDILGRNSDYHGDPLLILDDSFEIIFTNQKASTLFSIDDFNICLDQIFGKETVQYLIESIGPALNSSQKKNYKSSLINLKSGYKLEFDLSVEPIQLNETVNIILIFRSLVKINSNDILSKIKVSSLKNDDSINNTPLKQIIAELQSLAPFTIISIKRVKNVIDQYDLPIWIKDVFGKLIAINDVYEKILGVENSFAAGKIHETFLPPNQKAIYKMMDQYVLYNARQIILEGISNKNNNFEVISNIIQLPLVDNFNKITAMVGLIVDNKYDYYKFCGGEEFFNGLIKHFSKPAAYINSDRVIKYANENFVEFITSGVEHIVNKKIDEVFSINLIKKINSFFEEDTVEEFIETDESLVAKNSFNSNDRILLIKTSIIENKSPSVFITIESQTESIKFEDELQNILMHRGTMFDILIQKNPEPIFVYEKENLKFLEVNDAAVKLYGYSRDEFLQMDLTDLYAPEDIQTLLDSFGDEASESRFSKPFRHRKKDGTNVLVEISKTSFKFNDKDAHFNIIKDITDSIEKDKQYQILKIVFNESNLMIFNTDASGFITFANQNVFQNYGYTNDEILQSSFASLVADDDRGIVNTSIFQSHLKDSVVLQSKFKDSHGNLIDSEISASPVLDFDGGVDSFTIVVKPLTEKLNSDKPKEIIKEVIKEVVKEVVVEKSETTKPKVMLPDSNFLSGMFHEILTPINVIIGFSQELISSTENPTEEQLEASEIINQNRIKMMDTMNAVVEYSDIMQNKSPIKIENVTITDVIEKLDENIKDITGINDIQFAYGKISSSLKFKSDKQKFENFILSLIKVVSRLSKDKKVYFSAFAVESYSFIVGVSDQYGNPSEYVANVLEQVFGNDRDPKDFGLPKLTTYLARILLKLLGGKFYKSDSGTFRNETGFIFPMELSADSEKQNFYSAQEIISSIPTSEKISIEDFNKLVQDETQVEDDSKYLTKTNDEVNVVHKEISEAQKESAEGKFTPDDTDDIFKPVSPISQELLSKIGEKEKVEDDAFEQNDQSFKLPDENSSENVSDNNFNEATSEVEENFSEPIIDESISEIESVDQDKPAQTLDLTKLNCLYIEDQVDSQILFKVQMKELHDVKFAVSFEEAQLVLLNHQFDFIVMDINLQGEYNGLDALKIIKTMPAFSSIPIIAVTAYVLPGDKEKFIVAGFDDFISKPIFKEKMIESLEKIFLSH
jgi:PAS domain S-box-containing protein